jgi:hypothetical protein
VRICNPFEAKVMCCPSRGVTTVDVLEAPNEKVRNAINIYALYIIHTLLETWKQYVFREATCVFVIRLKRTLRFVKVEDEIVV